MKLIPIPIIKRVLILSCLCLLVSACGTHHGAARIVSIPTGAKVVNIDDGSIVGTTPLGLLRQSWIILAKYASCVTKGCWKRTRNSWNPIG